MVCCPSSWLFRVFNISLQSITQDLIVLLCIFVVILSLCGHFDVNNNSSCCDLPKACSNYTDFNEQNPLLFSPLRVAPLSASSTVTPVSTLVTLAVFPPTWQLNLIVSAHGDQWDGRFMSVRSYRSSQRANKSFSSAL